MGLTGLIGLKTLGRVPDELAGFVQPIVDSLPFWLNYSSRTNESTVHGLNVTTQGATNQNYSPNPILVPSNEIWYVHEYSVSAVVPAVAGDVLEGLVATLIFNQAGTLNWAPVGREMRTVTGVAGTTNGAAAWARNFWALPGMSLGFYFGRIASAGGVAFTGRYRATRIPV